LQLWIVRGERSLSRTRIATTERLGVIKRRLAEADEQVRKRKFENRA
jgi:hypothetical protein